MKMPMYDFECCHCKERYEMIVPHNTEYIKCVCGYIANKVMSVSNFHLKGHGWAKEGYASKKETILDRAPK